MKTREIIVAVERLEERLMKEMIRKTGAFTGLNQKVYEKNFVTKADLEELEKKFEAKLDVLEAELDQLRAKMLTRQDVKQIESRLRRKILVAGLVQFLASVSLITLFLML